MSRLNLRSFFIKSSNWEYWPAYIIYFPVFFYWVLLAILRRDIFFFSRVNKSIFSGGLFGASKYGILQQLPPAYIPKGILVSGKNMDVLDRIHSNDIKFPVVAKPDVAERGLGIRILKNEEELRSYHQCASFDFIVQEFLDLPYEISILFSRTDGYNIDIHSICTKEKMCIVGDGKKTLKNLINDSDRYRFQYERLKSSWDMTVVPKKGKTILLEPIGNHSRGTKFRDGRHLYSEKLHQVVANIAKQINRDINYGRFDILCTSHEDFLEDKNIYIVELNGTGSEPTHIYEPGFSFFAAQKSIFHISTVLYKISKRKERGQHQFAEIKQYLKRISFYRKNIKSIKKSMICFDQKHTS